MAGKKPIPVRFSPEALARLDDVAGRIGLERSGLIRFLVQRWLDFFETAGEDALPLDWQTSLERLDGRTRAARLVEARVPADPAAKEKRKARSANGKKPPPHHRP